jgi:hypothetical protein
LFDKLTTGLENLPATAAFVLSLSKDGRIWPSGKKEEIGATRRNGGEVGGLRHCSVTGP